MRGSTSFTVAVAGLLTLAAGQSHASVVALPAATSVAACSDNQAFPESTQGVSSCKLLNSQAHVDLLPAVQLSASGASGPGEATNSVATATYYFEVLGPNSVQVPIVIDTRLSTLIIGGGGASAETIVNTDPFDLANPLFNVTVTACQNAFSSCGAQPAKFDGAINMTAISNLQAKVSLSIIAGGANGGYGAAFADPMIMIDPSFADAADYHIVFSPGVGNILASVPEPATWAMLLLGLAGLGATLRGRRGAIGEA